MSSNQGNNITTNGTRSSNGNDIFVTEDMHQPMFDFQYLIAASHLRCLDSESHSTYESSDLINTKFRVKNTYFYPTQSCTTSLDLFQDMMQHDLTDLD